ncbi:N-acetylglucosamine-6-phosphate deacetylase [Haloimpatiens lingqiaonensis]|uniref:N-acetylglucosamine-6-phosphate deacetylase n=1 Tax=Haloimpatiens lingqiaonensis TaxID=1380675 RepID=UPI0010FD3A2D|nr:N-acetylglucosamine-6-phosphate deacetylase [Haloimpatiens lingqiaonensis]
MKIIKNGKIITKENIFIDKVLVFEEKILDIIEEKNLDEYIEKANIANIEVIDAKGKYVSPGFIDIHVHGCGGSDTMDGTLEDIEIISSNVCKNGVTAFLPTTMTMEKEKIYEALNVIRKSMGIKNKGAKVVGAHMEGPFINPRLKGAQNEKYIEKPDYNFIKEYLDTIKIITLAPEMDKDYEFIKKVKRDTDIVLSIGHTNATYEEAMEAIELGVSHGTHTFNAMSPLHHRNPGVVGAIFNSDVTCELIADKIHVHPGAFNVLINVKGFNKVVLITDCMRAGNLNEGNYDLGGQKVIVKENSARLEDGTLAGSILSLNNGVKNIFKNTNLSLQQVVSMASINPAKIINMEHKKGSIEIGKDADIVVFDEEFNIKTTIVEGNIVFKA